VAVGSGVAVGRVWVVVAAGVGAGGGAVRALAAGIGVASRTQPARLAAMAARQHPFAILIPTRRMVFAPRRPVPLIDDMASS
jgi:hypothetical protein